MSTRANLIRRGTGIVKVDILHSGPESVRANLKTSLFGTTGEQSTHIVEVRELCADITEQMLSTPNTPQFFLRVFGKNNATLVRNAEGVFLDENFYLGERIHAGGSTNNNGLIRVPEEEFTMYTPTSVYCIQDFLWKMRLKIVRINEVLHSAGWLQLLGDLNANVDGLIDGGVGTANYNAVPPIHPILPSEPIDDEKVQDLLECVFTPAGKIGFKGSSVFWNSFGIQLSPYAQMLFGLPELLIRNEDESGEENGTEALVPVGRRFGNFINDEDYTMMSTKSLYNTLEERISILVSSDIRQPYEQVLINGENSIRHIFGYFDMAGHRRLTAGRSVARSRFEEDWSIHGGSAVARQIMDPPGQYGFVSLVLPSIVPSFNIRINMLRKVWDFEKHTYSEQEVPLLKHPLDTAVIRLLFTLQQ